MHAQHSRNLPTIDTIGAVALSRRNGAEQAPLTAAAAYAIESASYYDRLPSNEQDDGYTSPSGSTTYNAYGQDQRRRYGSIDDQVAYGGVAYEGAGYSGGSVDQNQYPATTQYESIPIAGPTSSSDSHPGAGAMLYDPDYVIAMHDFSPGTPSATCLSFRAGEVIHVLNRDATGWWDGELEGRRGWFPSNYISTDAAAFAAAAELAGMNMAGSVGEEGTVYSAATTQVSSRPFVDVNKLTLKFE